jgi:hypothetical protein
MTVPLPTRTIITTALLRKVRAGFSLLEIILSLSMLAFLMIPVMVMTADVSRNGKNQTIALSRNLFWRSLQEAVDPEEADFGHTLDVTDTTTNPLGSELYKTQQNMSATRTLTDSGRSLPFIKKVDVANLSALEKTIYFYLYPNTSTAMTAPLLESKFTFNLPDFRIDVGNTTSGSILDASYDSWVDDNLAYDAASKTPGYVSGKSGVAGSVASTVDIVNTSGSNDALFRTYRTATLPEGEELAYTIPLAKGDYIVQLYFAETDTAVTQTAGNRRLMDIYLETALMTSAYSPFEVTGNLSNKAHILSYDTYVLDGALDIQIKKNTASTHLPRLAGIVVSAKES